MSLLRLTDEFQVPILRVLIDGGPNARPQVLLMLIERRAAIVHFCHVTGNAAFQAISYQGKAGVLPSICGTGFRTIAPLGFVFGALIPNMFFTAYKQDSHTHGLCPKITRPRYEKIYRVYTICA